MKFEAMFDEAGSDEELIATLGSPTKLAIGLAASYVPTPAPESMPLDTTESIENPDESVADISEEAAAQEKEEAPAGEAAEAFAGEKEEAESSEKAAPAGELPAGLVEEQAQPAPKRRLRPFGLIVAILFGLIFGVPIALVLILIGVPFLVAGIAVIATDVWCVLSAVPPLTMLSDILVVVGAGAVICGIGLLVTWFGLWLSFELGYLWIGGVVLRLGRALTYKKEVAGA